MLEQDNRWLRSYGMTSAPSSIRALGGPAVATSSRADQAVQQELEEEIAGIGEQLRPWFNDASGNRVVHVFRGQLLQPLENLQLLEGQDWTLAALEQLRGGSSGANAARAPDRSWADGRGPAAMASRFRCIEAWLEIVNGEAWRSGRRVLRDLNLKLWLVNPPPFLVRMVPARAAW